MPRMQRITRWGYGIDMKFNFKMQLTVFIAIAALVLIGIFLDCGSLLKVECHRVILGR
jgi:hypothetical protein